MPESTRSEEDCDTDELMNGAGGEEDERRPETPCV